MTKIRGRYLNGQVVLEGPPPDWENGLTLDIQPHRIGTSEEDDIDEPVETPEGIEAWIREVESIPPLVFTPEEEARFRSWQTEHKKDEIDAIACEFQKGITGAP